MSQNSSEISMCSGKNYVNSLSGIVIAVCDMHTTSQMSSDSRFNFKWACFDDLDDRGGRPFVRLSDDVFATKANDQTKARTK